MGGQVEVEVDVEVQADVEVDVGLEGSMAKTATPPPRGETMANFQTPPPSIFQHTAKISRMGGGQAKPCTPYA